jgi:hypothetical protein
MRRRRRLTGTYRLLLRLGTSVDCFGGENSVNAYWQLAAALRRPPIPIKHGRDEIGMVGDFVGIRSAPRMERERDCRP